MKKRSSGSARRASVAIALAAVTVGSVPVARAQASSQSSTPPAGGSGSASDPSAVASSPPATGGSLTGKRVAQAAAQPSGTGISPADGATVTIGGGGATTNPAKDQPQAASAQKEAKDAELPFRNSVFFFDQSVTTTTIGVGGTPQSYTPLYEWWLSFRPRWYFSDKFYVAARLDYTKEFTNAQGTTNYRQDVFGDAWTTASYETPITASENTKVKVSGILRWPLSQESQGRAFT